MQGFAVHWNIHNVKFRFISKLEIDIYRFAWTPK